MDAVAHWYGVMRSGAKEVNPPPRTGVFLFLFNFLLSHPSLHIILCIVVMCTPPIRTLLFSITNN